MDWFNKNKSGITRSLEDYKEREKKQNFYNIFMAIFIVVMGGCLLAGIAFWGKVYLAVDQVQKMVIKQKEDNSIHHKRLSGLGKDIKEAGKDIKEAKELAIEANVRSEINEDDINILQAKQ